MRNTLLILAAAIFLAGCSHNNGSSMLYDTNPDVTKAKKDFSSLEVVLPGAISPQSVSHRITVDRDKFMTVYLKFYEDFTLAYECDDTELLDDDTFLAIYNFTQDAGLIDMQSVVVDNCPGGSPTTITYSEMGGDTNEFDFMPCGTSTNELHAIVENMISYLEQVAEEEMQDCNEQSYVYGQEGQEGGEGAGAAGI